MNQSAGIWLLLVLAFAAANLPFLNERVFGLYALKGAKPFLVRVIELIALYLLIGLVGMTLERMIAMPSLKNGSFLPRLSPCFW